MIRLLHKTALQAALLSCVAIGGAQDGENRGPSLVEAKAAFEKADAELNKVYREVRAAISEFRFERLQEEQKEWLSFRDASAEADAVFNGGPEYEQRETDAPEYWQSMADSTETRVEMISAWINEKTPWAGLWADGYGGWLLIEETESPDAFSFRIHVVRGPTAHVGGISGTAKRNRHAGFFSDQGDKDYHFDESGEETWIWFSKDMTAPSIQLHGINTQPYHGARAFFDGKYTRLREPTAEDRKMFEYY